MARGEKPGEQVALLKEIADTLIRIEGELAAFRAMWDANRNEPMRAALRALKERDQDRPE